MAVDISKNMIESAKEIFSTMVMMEIEVAGDLLQETAPLSDSISGVIGLVGTHKGVLAIHLPQNVAMAVTGSFLGMDVEEVNEDVEDAVGELANMLAGDVKTALAENGRDIDISLPTIIAGREYDFQPTGETERIIIPFGCSAGHFSVELQLER